MVNIFDQLNYKLSEVKKFYFFEYFYILLKSVQKFEEKERIFFHFQNLKEALNLGDSKYKRIGSISDIITDKQLLRYRYTFQQVVDESLSLNLINFDDGNFILTEKGKSILQIYEANNPESFIEQLFILIESRTNGFHYLVSSLFEINPNNGGTLIFPSYSPLKLHFSKEDIIENNKFIDYLNSLRDQLVLDIKTHLNKDVNLNFPNNDLVDKLVETGLINKDYNLKNSKDYNLIVKRVRDFWANHFLRNIYNFKNINSISYFDLWAYRAKQIGLINITEFYPNVSGKMVYPTSIIFRNVKSNDFKKIFEYPNKEILYIHNPRFGDSFVSTLYETYLELKRSYRSYFVNLNDLRDMVSYKLKISNKKFSDLLSEAYELNLKGQLSISISLEVDKLPSEKAIYLVRDPIFISGKVKNIIAIEINTNKNE
ncbi:MAG: hypothetical protein JWR02_593 [Mucilaginibacter sp.]|nr:hypothetical protein [Mucilaginibacter sp.]